MTTSVRGTVMQTPRGRGLEVLDDVVVVVGDEGVIESVAPPCRTMPIYFASAVFPARGALQMEVHAGWFEKVVRLATPNRAGDPLNQAVIAPSITNS